MEQELESLGYWVINNGDVVLIREGVPHNVPVPLPDHPAEMEPVGVLKLGESDALSLFLAVQEACKGSSESTFAVEICIHAETGMPAVRIMLADGQFAIEIPFPPSQARRLAGELNAFAGEAEADGVTD